MAVPAIAMAAGLAYLSARWRVPVDLQLAATTAKGIYYCKKREKQDRFTSFYIIEENAQNKKLADKPFLLYEDRSWTFKQFYENALHYAGWLHSVHNVAQGEVVAINYMNSPEMLFMVVALWSLGATPALINYNLSGESLAHSIRTSSARMFIVESEVAARALTAETKTKLASPTFRNNQLPLQVLVLDPAFHTSLEYFKPYRAPDSARSGVLGRSTAVLIATSGTTGLPKQAIMPWLRYIGGGFVLGQYCQIRSAAHTNPDTIYTAMPLYHGTAFLGSFSTAVVNAATLAIGRRFSASSFWPDIRRHKVTAVGYVGEALRYLLAVPPDPTMDKSHRVRVAFGNGLRPDVWKQFKARFGIETIVEFFSATEGTFATWNVNRNDFSDGAVGQAGALYGLLLSRLLKLVKVDWESEKPWRDPKTGLCVEVPRGQPGEMIAKLDPQDPEALFQGYFNNERATQDKVLRNVFEEGDAYFRMGDVLRWDNEGRIWFVDRMGDTFRWKSENVSTMEVGEVMGYHPDVLEANVYGVSVPGHEGRAGCAALLLKDSTFQGDKGHRSVAPEVLRSLATYSRNSLQKVAVPVFLRVVTRMATTGNNKSIKHTLRAQGVDLQAIQNEGSGDRIYWLRPREESYVEFKQEHLLALEGGKARL